MVLGPSSQILGFLKTQLTRLPGKWNMGEGGEKKRRIKNDSDSRKDGERW